jgi:hypothetical protein
MITSLTFSQNSFVISYVKIYGWGSGKDTTIFCSDLSRFNMLSDVTVQGIWLRIGECRPTDAWATEVVEFQVMNDHSSVEAQPVSRLMSSIVIEFLSIASCK